MDAYRSSTFNGGMLLDIKTPLKVIIFGLPGGGVESELYARVMTNDWGFSTRDTWKSIEFATFTP